MKVILRIIIWLTLGIGVLALVYDFDPTMTSKLHGTLFTAIAVIFLVQDFLFWGFQKKADDVSKSTGVLVQNSDEMFDRSQRLKRYGWQIWGMALLTRFVALVLGQILQQVPFASMNSTFPGHLASGVQIVTCVGYASVVLGCFLTLKTYALFRHSEDVLAQLELRARQLAESREQADAILENADEDWAKDPQLGSYKRAKIKPNGK